MCWNCAGARSSDLAALLPSVSAAAKAQPAGERPRIRLLSALASLLERMSERSTLVVTLDDVHLADGSSWEALNYLSRNLADSRLLILLAAGRASWPSTRSQARWCGPSSRRGCLPGFT